MKKLERITVAVSLAIAATAFTPVGLADAAPRTMLASGAVESMSGRAVANAPVTLVVWPSQAVVSRVRVGGGFKLRVVAQTRTDAAGRYSLGAVDASLLSGSADEHGVVNYDVLTPSGSTEMDYGFSSAVTNLSTKYSADARSLGVTTEQSLPIIRVSAVKPVAGGTVQSASPLYNPPSNCNAVDKYDFAPHWDLVGQTYSTASYNDSDFIYTTGSSSSLGMGYSLTGSFGTFTAQGTHNFDSTYAETYPTQSGKKYNYFRTEFGTSKYYVTCDTGFGLYYYYIVATSHYDGGKSIIHPSSAPTATHCVPEDGGSSTIHTTKAVTWSNGLDTSGSFGLDLSSQTGYSSEAELTYKYHSSHARLCGVSGAPGTTPYQLVAK